MAVPTHFPKKIPDTINKGDPNPSNATQIKQKKKNAMRLKYRLLEVIFSKFICNSL
jgi:hypothetical protein